MSSTSGVGNCYDNAVAESFFGLLKQERVHWRQYLTRAEARADIFVYIEGFYSGQRTHFFTQNVNKTNVEAPPLGGELYSEDVFAKGQYMSLFLTCPWK